MSCRGLLEAWFHARLEAVRARTQREQEVLLQQQHISEGMAKAASCSDEILALLKSSADSAEAVSKLMGTLYFPYMLVHDVWLCFRT